MISSFGRLTHYFSIISLLNKQYNFDGLGLNPRPFLFLYKFNLSINIYSKEDIVMNFIILATSTASTVVQGVVTGIVCLIIIGAAFFVIYQKKKSDTNAFIDEEINNMLNNITDMVIETLTSTIKNIDFNNYQSIADAQAAFLTEVYDKVYTYAFDMLEEEYKDRQNLIELAETLLTRERIEDFVNNLFGKEEIQSKLISQYNVFLETKNVNAEKEDEEAELEGQKYEDGTIETDNTPIEDLDPNKLPHVDEPELNPQEEREEEVIDIKNDSSVEVVKTETVPIEDILSEVSNAGD